MVRRPIALLMGINNSAIITLAFIAIFVIQNPQQIIRIPPNIGVNKAAKSKFLIHPPCDTVCQIAVTMRMGNKNVGIDLREPVILNRNTIRNICAFQHHIFQFLMHLTGGISKVLFPHINIARI